MDKPDKEFEAFLQQFHLRKHRPFPVEPEVGDVKAGRTARRWILVAAAAVLAVAVTLPLVRHFSQTASPTASVEVAGDSVYRPGETLAAGTPVRSGELERLLVNLEDGTRVEMRPKTELVLEAADDGARIRLNHGSILVSAAQQKKGRLHVEAHDIVASVVGTVFLVETQPAGSRVGVLEGEVEVRHKLVQGQQVSTGSSLEGQTLAEALAWSSRGVPVAQPIQTSAVAPPEPAPAVPSRKAQTPTPQDQLQPEPQAPPPPQPPPQQEQPAAPGGQDGGADSAGKALVEGMCATCHAADLITGKNSTRSDWQGTIDRMKGYGTVIDDKQTAVLLEYLVKNYGPKQAEPPAPTAPPQQPPPSPSARAVDQGRQVFYRACVSCHSDAVMTSRQWPNREAVANRVATDIRMGAAVSASETSDLIEFIFGTWGVRFR